MAQPNDKWYLRGPRVPEHVIPGKPRRSVAQEFFSNVIALGEHAREQYLAECKAGVRAFDQADLDELDANLNVCRAELAKYR